MRVGAFIAAQLLALMIGACSQPAPPPESTRENEDARKSLPDAYKHPPK
jgi:hypothetical protein